MRSTQYEAVLDASGVVWTYLPLVPLSDINELASKNNQARLEPITESLCDEYAAGLRNGNRFPPLVGVRNSSGQFVLIDGNHRLKAFRMVGFNSTDMYEVKTTDLRAIQELTFSFNQSVNGARSKGDDALLHAVELVKRNGRTIDEAASTMSLPYNRVREAVALDDIYARLSAMNVSPRRPIAPSTLGYFTGISTDAALAAAVAAVEDGHLNTMQAADLARAIRKERSEKKQLEAVEAYRASPAFIAQRDRFAPNGKKARTRGVQIPQFFAHVASACTIIRGLSAKNVGLTADHIRAGDKAVDELNRMWAALKQSHRSQS